ncbi:MAG: 5'-nucleotidase [Candidatus Cloacimonadales bacterium]
MPYSVDNKLVVGISANALFDLKHENDIFIKDGLPAYRAYQIENKDKILPKGVAFPFIRRLLHINQVYQEEQPIEVVLLSKNSPETGIRIFNSIKHYQLDISRATFMSGQPAYKYIPAFNISLYLSTNEHDVNLAIAQKYAAGRVLETDVDDLEDDWELRVAFDFDGVIADDESEKIYQAEGLENYSLYESAHRQEGLKPGPLADFFRRLAIFQKLESEKEEADPEYKRILKTAIVTARSAPAHERAVNTLKYWGVAVDEMFLLGGIEKRKFLEILKPHIYFDDSIIHLDEEMKNIPMVHIPFGVNNQE